MRERRRELAHACWMLGWIAASIAWREPLLCCAGGSLALVARIVDLRGAWTPSGRFGAANGLTLLRLALIASLPAQYLALPRLAFAGLVPLLLALDALDGVLARTRGDASPFGAQLDMETDALGVMVLTLIAWEHRLAGGWLLVAGLWRYAYAALVAAVPALAEAPRNRFGRAVFAVLMSCLAGVFLPVPVLPSVLGVIGTVAVSISFGYSLARSRAVSGKAASSSDAASDQERGERRAA